MTLHRWRKSNHISYKKLSSRKFLYDIDSVLEPYSDKGSRQNVIYARVSNSNQKDNLVTQINVIKGYMIANGIKLDLVFDEIASGMNENRVKFNKLIHLVFNNKVNKIYITYKDRLSRFGFEYFVNMFREFGTEIIVINAPEDNSVKDEMVNDLISIIHHFSMKIYSNRRKTLQECVKKLRNPDEII